MMTYITITTENAEAFRPYILAPEFHRLSEPECFGLGLVEDGLSSGALVMAPLDERHWELISLYLDPLVRGRGEGTRLLETGKAAARGAGAEYLMAAFAFPDNRPMAAFLEHRGFGPGEVRAHHYTLPLESLAGLRFFSPEQSVPPEIVPILEVPEEVLGSFLEETWGMIPYAISLEKHIAALEEELSFAWVNAGGRMQGYSLFCVKEEGLFLSAAFFLPDACGRVLQVLRHSFQVASRLLIPETPVHICAINELSKGLIERITQGAQRMEEWHTVCPLT